MSTLKHNFTRQNLHKTIAQWWNINCPPQMDRLPSAVMVVSKKKKKSSTSCCNAITSTKSMEAYTIHLCPEYHVFFYGGDCAKCCVTCAKGSKQLPGRARTQLRGNIGNNELRQKQQFYKSFWRV